jgi:signal peptidase I
MEKETPRISGRPELTIKNGKDLNLSGPVLASLMKEILGKGIPFRFQARGWSMTPFIRDGDIITVVPQPRKQFRLGEIVAFIQAESGKPVVHRIIGKNRRGYQIQGDNISELGDGWIAKDNILGLIHQVERQGVKIRLGLKGPERYGIALASRFGLLSRARKVIRKMRMRSI